MNMSQNWISLLSRGLFFPLWKHMSLSQRLSAGIKLNEGGPWLRHGRNGLDQYPFLNLKESHLFPLEAKLLRQTHSLASPIEEKLGSNLLLWFHRIYDERMPPARIYTKSIYQSTKTAS